MEVGHFLIKNVRGSEGKRKLDKVLEYEFNITELKYPLTRKSLNTLTDKHETGIGGRNATILASMQNKDVVKLVTHDKAFKKIEEIELIDPIN